MPLTGQAKTDYMKEYMRKRRSNARSNEKPESVRPEQPELVRPKRATIMKHQCVGITQARPVGISDHQWAYMQYKAEEKKQVDKAEDAAGLVALPVRDKP